MKREQEKTLKGLEYEEKESSNGKPFKEYERIPRKRKYDNTLRGYNMNALRLYLALAGYKPTSSGVAKACGMSVSQAYRRLTTGAFERHDIQLLKDKLKLNDEEVGQIFFNGEEPKEHPKNALYFTIDEPNEE